MTTAGDLTSRKQSPGGEEAECRQTLGSPGGVLCLAIISAVVRTSSRSYCSPGDVEERLLQLVCHIRHTDRFHPRLHLDTDSGCWSLPQAGRGDSCVYEVRDRGAADKVLTSTSIRVLDPVLIYNISSNSSRLGEDIAVTVQFSGEESHVTWELDGGRLPERYRLIDDNRTLIIPSLQRDDAERTFRVRVTNPVSEEVRDHRLEIRDADRRIRAGVIVGIIAASGGTVMLLMLIFCIICRKSAERRKTEENGT
ncbi:uncharacterized protein [Hyperolius riggenbachi]|uniref:uncharacterized protein n=1 Tax=Hyperolius riggenbachi TaxID=752182 RepID=UPI0035A3650D